MMNQDPELPMFTTHPDGAELSYAVRRLVHDLNNQMMILLNSLDRILMLRPDEPDAREALKVAERCAELTAQLIPALTQQVSRAPRR